MENVVQLPVQDDLGKFVDFLYEGLEGYVYLAAKDRDDPDSWDQAFFEWPTQRTQLIQAVNHYSPTLEIYIAPALFSKKNAEKDFVKVTNVLWTEFDGNTPVSFDIPPSMIVRSSEPGHEHVYWKLSDPLTSIETIEDLNRRICFKYGADNSAWDANQVLRPPYTLNHKRGGLPVAILSSDEALTFNLAVFDDLAPAPEKTVDYSLWERMDLPSLNDVIYSNRFGPDFKLVFEKTKDEVADRSATLTHAAYICAEAGLSDKEIYVILDHLAKRWEKFNHHTPSNKAKQLIAIIEHTRVKYPHSNFNELDTVISYSPLALLQADIEVEWAIENVLMSTGSWMLAGESGIGKSQIFMQFMFHLAMGLPYLDYKIDKPHKIGFFSLEMGSVELKSFLESMYPTLADTYSPEHLALLNENLTLLPFGESLPLNTTKGQDVVVEYLETHKWDGIFIDSVGTAVIGSLNDQATVQSFTNFVSKIRKRYGIFVGYIHHMRKPGQGQANTAGKSDVYGDQYLVNSVLSVHTVSQTDKQALEGIIKVRNVKNRHAKMEDPYYIKRTDGLTFERTLLHSNVSDTSTDSVASPEKVVVAFHPEAPGVGPM